MIDPEATGSYAELFDATADATEIDPLTGLLIEKADNENLAAWYRLRASFITRRGYTKDEFNQLSRMVDEDVANMRSEIERATPQDFTS